MKKKARKLTLGEEEQRLNAYRAVIATLCLSNGGTYSIDVPELPPGTIMWRWTEDGLEFKFQPDGKSS